MDSNSLYVVPTEENICRLTFAWNHGNDIQWWFFWKDGLNLAYFPVFTNLKARASVSSIRILVTNYLSYFFSLEIYQLKKIYLLLTTSALSKENENAHCRLISQKAYI